MTDYRTNPGRLSFKDAVILLYIIIVFCQIIDK
jgi:hypothetical protein